MSLAKILADQKRWARNLWPDHRGLEAPSIESNLFRPLSPATWAEFAVGRGDELGLSGRRPKMRSLRSSSALACNVFELWRGRDLMPLGTALGLRGHFIELHFERKCPHGLNSEPPNLDLVLYPSEGSPVGIESKFTEPYGSRPARPPLKAKYFDRNVRRWEEVGLPRCQLLAESLGKAVVFCRLDAGQLLKHILGLAWPHRNSASIRLLDIWFDGGGAEADEYRGELRRFSDALDPEVEFSQRTYQETFQALREFPEPAPGYLSYLETRYFAGQ